MNAFAVNSGSTPIGFNLLKAGSEILCVPYLVNQTKPFSSFDSFFKSCQHVFSPHRRFRPLPSGADFSGLFRLFSHCRRSCFHLCVHQHSPPCHAFAPCQLRHFTAHTMALTSVRRFFDPLSGHERRPCPDSSPCLTHTTSRHSATNHPMTHHSRFITIPFNSVAVTSFDASELRHSLASSSHHLAESFSLSADCQFSSRCSPPYIAVTQLRSDTDRRSYVWRGLSPPSDVRPQAHECGNSLPPLMTEFIPSHLNVVK